jgi:hypothetical protein
LGEQFEGAILERRGFGGAFEPRFGGSPVGGSAHRLRVIDVRGYGL